MTMKTYTAVIIGGGPAGCECALWLKMLGLNPVIIEQSDHLGGLQALSPYQNHWIAGVMNTSGREFANNIQHHIEQQDIPVLFNTLVTDIQQRDQQFQLEMGSQIINTSCVVIATGSLQRKDAEFSHDQPYADLNMTAQGGWQANLPHAFHAFHDKLLNEDGFITTNTSCETPVAGIYAIGEAANRMHPCVVTSMADGVVAAKAIQASLATLS
jgi:adhesin HecA-like repeat protein